MALSEVVAALAEQLAGTLTGWQPYSTAPGSPVVPAFVVFPQSINPSPSFSPGADYALVVTLLDDIGAFDLTRLYEAIDGDASVITAIHSDPTLDGNVDSARASFIEDSFGIKEWAGTRYLGADILVEVFT